MGLARRGQFQDHGQEQVGLTGRGRHAEKVTAICYVGLAMRTPEQERHRLYMREYGKTDKYKAWRRDRYQKRLDEMRAEKNRYHKRARERAKIDTDFATRRRRILLRACNDYRERMRLRVIEHYSNGTNTCRLCGYNNIEALCIDHINDDGASHRKTIGCDGAQVYCWLVKQQFPSGFQVLCHNCNWIKEKHRRHSMRAVA